MGRREPKHCKSIADTLRKKGKLRPRLHSDTHNHYPQTAQHFVPNHSGRKLKSAPRPGLFQYLLRLIRRTWAHFPAGNSKSSFNLSSLHLDRAKPHRICQTNMPASVKVLSQVYAALIPTISLSWLSAQSHSYATFPSSNSLQPFLNMKEQQKKRQFRLSAMSPVNNVSRHKY